MSEDRLSPRRDLFRAAAQARLIDDPAPWFEFHEARNLVSHTYNEATARQVVMVAERFLPCAASLPETLEKLQEVRDGLVRRGVPENWLPGSAGPPAESDRAGRITAAAGPDGSVVL